MGLRNFFAQPRHNNSCGCQFLAAFSQVLLVSSLTSQGFRSPFPQCENLRIFLPLIHPWTEVVYQNLESKKALFYIFDSTGSVFENSEKPLF